VLLRFRQENTVLVRFWLRQVKSISGNPTVAKIIAFKLPQIYKLLKVLQPTPTLRNFFDGYWWPTIMGYHNTPVQWRTQKIFMGGFQSAKVFLCTKIESMIRKNIKQAAIQYVNVVKQL